MNSNTQACSGCGRGISPLIFLCWPCLSRLPRELRKAIDVARATMQRSYSAENMAAYREVREQAIAAAVVGQVTP